MHFDSDVYNMIGIAAAGIGVGSIGVAWMIRRMDTDRSKLPIAHAHWKDHANGWSVTIHLVNRLDEDIFVERVEAKASFVVPLPASAGIGANRRDEANWIVRDNCIVLDVWIGPQDSRFIDFFVAGPDTPHWLELNISSSLQTLRSKRLIIHDMPQR